MLHHGLARKSQTQPCGSVRLCRWATKRQRQRTRYSYRQVQLDYRPTATPSLTRYQTERSGYAYTMQQRYQRCFSVGSHSTHTSRRTWVFSEDITLPDKHIAKDFATSRDKMQGRYVCLLAWLRTSVEPIKETPFNTAITSIGNHYISSPSNA